MVCVAVKITLQSDNIYYEGKTMYHNNGIFLMRIFNFVFIFAITVVAIVVIWKIFIKAGEKGWKAVIPFYNGYVMITKIARKSAMYFWIPILGTVVIVTVIAPLILTAIMGFRGVNKTGAIALFLFGVAFYIYVFVLSILLNLAIAKNFGQSTGFAVGLIILPFIFYPILAFGDSKFIYSIKKDEIIEEDDEYEYIYVGEDEEEEE